MMSDIYFQSLLFAAFGLSQTSKYPCAQGTITPDIRVRARLRVRARESSDDLVI